MAHKTIIPYVLPGKPAKFYSDNALKILKKIEQKCFSALPIFLRSDIAITLSGVRTYDAYVGDLTEYMDKSEIEKIASLLKEFGVYLESWESEYSGVGGEKSGYFLINKNALKEIPNQYRLEAWVEPNPPYNADRFLAWSKAVELRIHKDMIDEKLPRRWSDYWWAQIIIWEGLLYGFPGAAITSIIDWDFAMAFARDSSEEPDPHAESNIAHHDEYFAPHVAYDYTE